MTLAYAALAFLVVATVYSAIVSFRPATTKPGWIFPEPMNQSKRMIAGALGLVLLAAVALALGLGTRTSPRPSSRFLIPDGYTGWVRIEFEVKDAPPLPTDRGEYVLQIPPNGVLRTSSPEQYGWANDCYYYYYYYSSPQAMRPLPDSGPTQLIWGKLNGEEAGASGRRKYEEFFVGTLQQFKDQSK
jgi:hypothetical protein